jgi:S-adenosylmethionine hydrolase
VESKGQIFIGPDNGLFSFAVGEEFQAWELRNSNLFLADPGKTFHGRDVFAPAASHIAAGISSSEFGPSLSKLTRLPTPRLKMPAPGSLQGEVLYADRFGNLLTSLGRFVPVEKGLFSFAPWIREVGTGIVREAREMQFRSVDHRLFLPNGDSLDWVSTFAGVPANGCAFLVGSSGLLEIVANRESAAQLLGMQRGDQVTLRSRGDA